MDHIHCILIAAGVGAGVGVAAVVAVPVIIACLGFTARGIARGSVASSMMSYSAMSNGGGVRAGGVVATLQSIGTAGICIIVVVVIGAIGGTVAGAVIGTRTCKAGDAGATTIIPVTGQGMVGDAVSATVAGLISNYTV
ncbi:interferon alpha-inducible protein 27, mitochondrial-like isoform X1 [Rhinichthys klamathensis goyatoka]|uniref:interferon alpha-inducible protein 27, mitochondrial-like isoform X1 n=1 Tax=Rhinichthys klamathensis goyatoka TaxID=3034132 RepID=UPI0024B5AF8A|nr:interferon alpha-inducible protein 27, mitochondrial-like isoform X1 [Rhinichthys klamathensis goyatoka]